MYSKRKYAPSMYSKKNIVRSKRTYKRSKMMLTKPIYENLMGCKRATLIQHSPEGGSMALSFNCSTVWSWQNFAFRLVDLPNVTEFTNLFKMYKVNALKYQFLPRVNVVEGTAVAQAAATANPFVTQPRLYTVIDRAGNASINSESAILQYSNKRQITKPLEAFSIYIKSPCVQLVADSTTSGPGSELSANKWIDCVNTDVYFSGCGIGGIQPDNGLAGILYQVVCTAYLQFKGVR